MTDVKPTAADQACAKEISAITPFDRSFTNHDGFRLSVTAIIASHTAEQLAPLRADCADCHERLNAYKAKLAAAQQALEECGSTGETVAAGIRRLAFHRKQAEQEADRLRAVNAELLAAAVKAPQRGENQIPIVAGVPVEEVEQLLRVLHINYYPDSGLDKAFRSIREACSKARAGENALADEIERLKERAERLREAEAMIAVNRQVFLTAQTLLHYEPALKCNCRDLAQDGKLCNRHTLLTMIDGALAPYAARRR